MSQQQNDAVTKAAYDRYPDMELDTFTYSDEPCHQVAMFQYHRLQTFKIQKGLISHQCSPDTVGDALLNNCKWDDACTAAGGWNMLQYCKMFPW